MSPIILRKPCTPILRRLGAFPLVLALSSTGLATPDPAGLCLDAAVAAAWDSGVPEEVLTAITLVETGRDARPWPWTVNIGGEGHWLATAAEAATLVEVALAEGVTNIDLGCFQLNHRWHGDGFASVEGMLDPMANAAYAADFLASHHARTGDWADAAAAYHSATPAHADRYRARFEETLASLDGHPAATGDAASPGRQNRFPLLLAGQSGTRGSLVPQSAGGLWLIGEP